MKKFMIAVCLFAASAAFAGCGSKTEAADGQAAAAGAEENDSKTQKPDAESTETETISVIGSTTIQPLAQSIADVFQSKNPDLTIEIQGVGSSAGIKAVIDGTANIGAASRTLKEEEKASGLTEYVLAYDGIAVVTNRANPVTDLDSEIIRKIFAGEITNWNEIGGADAPIIVVSREAGSGTRDAFEELVALQKEVNGSKMSALKADALVAEGNGAVKANVASKENAIAYLSLGYVDDSLKAISVDGVAPTVEAVKTGEYPISRTLLLLTNGELTPGTKKYLDFCFGAEGQEIVADKYIPVN